MVLITLSLMCYSAHQQLQSIQAKDRDESMNQNVGDHNPIADKDGKTKWQESVGKVRYYEAVGEPEANTQKRFLKIKKLVPENEIPVHPIAAEEPYLSRMKKIQEACDSGPYLDTIDTKRFLYDDKHKIVMCVVPKNACTTWKGLVLYLYGKSTLEDAFDNHKHFFGLSGKQFKKLNGISKEEAISRLNSYTKFMVTRHPFDRLLSAQQNKFQVPETRHSYRQKTGRAITHNRAKEYLPNIQINWTRPKEKLLLEISERDDFKKLSTENQESVLEIIALGYNGNVDFEHFINSIVLKTNNSKLYDIHWRPQHLLCNPCAIKFDYVIDFDNLYEESERLLDWIQRDDPPDQRIHIPVRSPKTTSHSTKEMFEIFSPEKIEHLKKVYANDFKYFSHDLEKY